MMSNTTMDSLPPGWIKQYDERTGHPFWVDTKATPARSTWVHPYEDEQFLSEHPEFRGRGEHAGPPPPYSPRRHSYSGSTTAAEGYIEGRLSASQPSTPYPGESSKHKQRGFFGKLKDKAIGTKEEREATKRREMMIRQQRQEQLRQQMAMPIPQRPDPRMGNYGGTTGVYGPPMGNPYAYTSGFAPGGIGGRRMGGGFGGMGLPLLGGLAGGLLLGEALDHDHYGDGWGGGGFDGGGWGDGGFDNGFF